MKDYNIFISLYQLNQTTLGIKMKRSKWIAYLEYLDIHSANSLLSCSVDILIL